MKKADSKHNHAVGNGNPEQQAPFATISDESLRRAVSAGANRRPHDSSDAGSDPGHVVERSADLRALLGHLPRQCGRPDPGHRRQLLPEPRYGRGVRDRELPRRPSVGASLSAPGRGSDEPARGSAEADDYPGDAAMALRAGRERMGNQLRLAVARHQAADLSRVHTAGGQRLSARAAERRHGGLRGLRRGGRLGEGRATIGSS